MQRTMKVSRYCCADCGGSRVETLDWVTVNEEELVGGDVGSDYFCPDCDGHPSHTEEREIELELCERCATHEWGTVVPLPGVRTGSHNAIERCQECKLYSSDAGAAEAVCAEVNRRGGNGRLLYVVAGISSVGG